MFVKYIYIFFFYTVHTLKTLSLNDGTTRRINFKTGEYPNCLVVIGGNLIIYVSGSPIQQFHFGCLGMCRQAQKIPFDLVLNERKVDMFSQHIAIFKPVWEKLADG